jgi:2-polyprenyl-6-methoxyphenol hydroxylase-like FAD-dependent oxidoreductase
MPPPICDLGSWMGWLFGAGQTVLEAASMYDVIIVGARVAGAPLAFLLARRGYRVLLLDKAKFPSDISSSTLLIWPPGVALLRKWGVLEQVQATGAPPIGRYRAYFGPPFGEPQIIIDGAPKPSNGGSVAYAPRRITLDHILVNEAVAAGAAFQDGVTVDEVLTDGDQVTGIRGTTASGGPVRAQAKLVVGADGANSVVARAVAASEYMTRDPVVLTYYAYWRDIRLNIPEAQLDFAVQPWGAVYAWPTNDDHMLIGANWARPLHDAPPPGGAGYTPLSADWRTEFARIQGNVEAYFQQMLAQAAPWLAAQCRDGARRVSDLFGGWVRNFYRKPYGPGWALVGDASHAYEFTSAHGITNAMRQADLLAEAIDDGMAGRQDLMGALEGYHRRRDDAEIPYYDFTYHMTTYQPVDDAEGTLALYQAISKNPEATAGFWGVFGQTVLPAEFFSEENCKQLLSGA